MIPTGIILALLLLATAHQWRKVRQDERPNHMAAAVARGDADAHQCEVCHRVAAVREVVPLYDDAVLVCLGCASLLKYQRQEAA